MMAVHSESPELLAVLLKLASRLRQALAPPPPFLGERGEMEEEVGSWSLGWESCFLDSNFFRS